jgi:hypothetical protein
MQLPKWNTATNYNRQFPFILFITDNTLNFNSLKYIAFKSGPARQYCIATLPLTKCSSKNKQIAQKIDGSLKRGGK